MEKFGIFELLDALSALTAREEAQNAPSADPAPDETHAPGGAAPAASPSLSDAAFSAPVYSAPGNPAPDKTEKKPAAGADRDALAGFLARHEAVAKKAKNPRPQN